MPIFFKEFFFRISQNPLFFIHFRPRPPPYDFLLYTPEINVPPFAASGRTSLRTLPWPRPALGGR